MGQQEKTTREVELLISALREETGVGERFLEGARPAIEKTFAEVPVENREICLKAVWASARRQAKTEFYLSEAMHHAKKIEESGKSVSARFLNLERQTDLAEKAVAETAGTAFSGLGIASNSSDIN